MFVGIIWRESADRIAAFEQTVNFWISVGADIQFFDSGHPIFNRAASRNLAVRTAADSGHNKLVISDADCIPQYGPLNEAWDQADDTGVHLPYTVCIVHAPDGRELGMFDFTCGGVYVTTPTSWVRVGGQDERFTKWAPEDMAFSMAHNTLAGPLRRHDGILKSLGHARDPHRHSDSEDDPLVLLYRQYEAANGNPELMKVLCSLS